MQRERSHRVLTLTAFQRCFPRCQGAARGAVLARACLGAVPEDVVLGCLMADSLYP